MQSNEITIQITSQMSADQLGEWINEVMADAAETLSDGESVAVKSVTPAIVGEGEFVEIDGADYVALNYRNHLYFIGEEVLLNADHQEIGWVCTRGERTVVAATDADGHTVAQRNCHSDVIETEGDVIDLIHQLYAEAIAPDNH